MFSAFQNQNTLPGNMSLPDYPIPKSQVAIQMDACADPISSTRINQTAEMPLFPAPRAGRNTLVRVLYNSPNPIDYKLLAMYWLVPRLLIGPSPINPGASFVGRVWRTTHPDLKAGDLVWGKHDSPSRHGSGGTFTLISGDQGIVKVPGNWPKDRSFEEFAGAAMVAPTALQTLQAADLPFNASQGQTQGGSIFINGGSGGVGIFTVQLAKNVFGCKNIVVSCSASNIELVKSLGATEVVDYRNCPNGVPSWLKNWAAQNGTFDAIIDNVGHDASIYWQCAGYLKKDKGRYIQVGGGLDFWAIADTAKKMMWPSALGGGKREYQFLSMQNKKDDFVMLSQWMSEGKLKCIIEDENRFDLADGKKAYQKLDTGRVRGKIIIKMDQDQSS